MDLKEKITKVGKDIVAEINKDRDKIECPFVFSLWRDPTLYDDYKEVNEGTDQTLKTDDAIFFFKLGKQMYKKGYKTFDGMALATFLEDKPTIKRKFDDYGGLSEIDELKSICDPENIQGYYDNIAKLNLLDNLSKTYTQCFGDVDRYKKMSSEEIYDVFDYNLNAISLSTDKAIKIEDLSIDNDFLEECNSGMTMGLDYSKYCPLLCSKTMGAPLGDLMMIAGYSGTGKTSFIFENMVVPIVESGNRSAIISNEMGIKAYKMFMLIHILTQELNYWKLTRKKIKQGSFDEEEWDKLYAAQRIQKEKYDDIKFIKMFDNDMKKITKISRALAKKGYNSIVIDTLKSSDDSAGDGNMWQQLLVDSRKLFQMCSKENISVIVTYQLALHTENTRFLSSSCLSNSKQIKEVFSEMIYFRKIWDDERDEKSKFYCNPYRLKKTNSGKYVKEAITLDSDKRYLIGFLDKTRNDEDGIQFIYEWNARFNSWKELGYVTIINTHS